MKNLVWVFTVICITSLFGQTKLDVWLKKNGISRNQTQYDFSDRKRSVFDVGNLVLRFSNAAILGYDRWGLNHEFPAGSITEDSCCTYYWTMSPIIGALINGKPSVAVGARGTYRDHDEEFEPLPGYDAGYVDEMLNIGIAFSDKPESWPPQWPIEIDPNGTYYDSVTGLSFPGIEMPLDMNQPDGSGLRFPGVDNGIVRAAREAYFVVTDNDPEEGNTFESNGVGPLNVRVDMWGLQSSDLFTEDFIIFKEVFTNVGSDTLFDVFVGLVGDPDTPVQGGAEWTDDYCIFIKPNDPNLSEKVVDTTDSYLLWNLAMVWDGDDYSEGFLESGVGWVGLKVLETPDDMGVTTFFPYPYNLDAQSDNDAYYSQLLGGFGYDNPNMTGYQESPHPDDIQQKPYAYGPDITWVIASGPFTLPPGDRISFIFADILGEDEKELLYNARVAQMFYNCEFKYHNIEVTYPNGGEEVSGVVEITWIAESVSSDPVDFIDIFLSSDGGQTWEVIASDENNDGSFLWDTKTVPDGVMYRVRIVGYDGACIGQDLSDSVFTVNNPGNGYPFVDLLAPDGREYLSNEALVVWFASDPDGDEVTVDIEYSPDAGFNWFVVEDGLTNTGQYEWQTSMSANSVVGLLRLTASDGSLQYSDISHKTFTVHNKRTLVEVSHTSGRSNALVEVHVADSLAMSDDLYRIIFTDDYDAVDDTVKSYSLLNVNSGNYVFENVNALDGLYESPIFDGRRIYVKDWKEIEFLPDRSGWITGDCNWTLSAQVVGQANDDIYEIRFTRDSTEVFSPQGSKVPIEVWNISDSLRFEKIIVDPPPPAGGGPINSGDEIRILEVPNGETKAAFTWKFQLLAPDSNSIEPELGDVARFEISIPFEQDHYEFSSGIIGIEEERTLQQIPLSFNLKQNYPNPFNPVTTIEFELPYSSRVELVIYNILGQKVETLVSGRVVSGRHEAIWDASKYASGIYFYRLTTDYGHRTRKMLVLK